MNNYNLKYARRDERRRPWKILQAIQQAYIYSTKQSIISHNTETEKMCFRSQKYDVSSEEYLEVLKQRRIKIEAERIKGEKIAEEKRKEMEADAEEKRKKMEAGKIRHMKIIAIQKRKKREEAETERIKWEEKRKEVEAAAEDKRKKMEADAEDQRKKMEAGKIRHMKFIADQKRKKKEEAAP